MKKSCVPRVKNLQRSMRPKMRQSAAITVIGRDNTGGFTRVTTFLIEQRAGIETLKERAARGRFTMTLQASWVASDCHAAGVRAGLDRLARQLRRKSNSGASDRIARRRFALEAIRKPHNFKALMVSPCRREIKANPCSFRAIAPFTHRSPTSHRAPVRGPKRLRFILALARLIIILPPHFVWRFKNRIINLHPSLLPCFPGPPPRRGHAKAARRPRTPRTTFRCD